jgi:hypothetical protein
MKAASERSVAGVRIPAKRLRGNRCRQPSKPAASSVTPASTRQWLHLWLHSPAISKAREWSCLGRRPAHTVGAVTADQWVDDLESERPARVRGFESLRFRPSTSANTKIMITSRLSVNASGCISGSNARPKVTHLAALPTGWLRCAVEGSLAHGGPCTSWREVPPPSWFRRAGWEICLVSGGSWAGGLPRPVVYSPTVARLPRWAR